MAADPTRHKDLPRRELRKLPGGRDLCRQRAETAVEERRKPKQSKLIIPAGTVR